MIVATLIILLAYLIPVIPITRQIRTKKKQNLSEIRKLMESEYQKLLADGHSGNSKMDSSRFDTLAELYKSVKSVRAYPPVGHYSVRTILSVSFLTILPTVVEAIKNVLDCFTPEQTELGMCLLNSVF